VRVLCDEGVADHIGPESCTVQRKRQGEALTGENAGEVLSCEIRSFGVLTLLSEAEGHTGANDMASPRRTPRSRRPSACGEVP
jgi:hypothetical protein